MSVTRSNDGRASSITKAHQAAVNAQIITEANPWMANDPETLMRLATSGADPVSLATNAGAMAGMEGIEKLGAAMEGMTEVGKRAAYGRLTEQQQRALASMGYAPVSRDKGFLDGTFLEGAWDTAADVAGTIMSPVSTVATPVLSKAFDFLAWAGDVPGHFYRAIRQMEGWQQWLALAVGAGAVLATGGAALAGFAPAAALLGGAATMGGSLGVAGALGGIGLGAATLSTIPTAIHNPTEWWDVMNPFGRTGVGRGERVFSRQGQERAAQILGGAEHLHAVARDIAANMDLEDIAHEFAGVQNASNVNVMMKSIERVAETMADPGTQEFEAVYQGLATLVEQPEFVQAVDELQSSKISVGRDVAAAVGFQPGDFGHGLLSGSVDALWLFAMDPTLMLGKLGKLQQLARRGVRGESGPELIQTLTRMVNEDEAVGAVAKQISSAVDQNRISQMPRAWRGMFHHMQEYRRGHVGMDNVFDEEQFLKYLEHGDGIRRLMEGKGTIRGVERIVVSTINKDQGWGKFLDSVRNFQHGLTDPILEYDLRKTAKLFGKEADLNKALPPGVDDMSIDMGFEWRTLDEPLQETMSYKAGRAIGHGLVYAPIPGTRTVGNVISGLTTMIPPGKGIALTGEEAAEHIPRFIETFGRHLNMPSNLRTEWLDNVMAQSTVGQRRAALRSFMDSGFTAAGMRSSDELEQILNKYLSKYDHAYALGGADKIRLVDGTEIIRGILPEHHQAAFMVMPDLRELSKVIRSGHIAKHVAKITDSNFAEQAMSRVIKPGWLMRIGFIPRAAGEEMLAFWLRMSEGGIVQEYVGRKVGLEDLRRQATHELANGTPYNKLDPGMRYALENRVPKHLRPVVKMGEREGWTDPADSMVATYLQWKDRTRRSGVFGGRLDLPDDTPEWARVLMYGKHQSIRHLVVRGVDPDLAEAGYRWQLRHADAVMKQTSSMNMSQFEKSVVSPETTTIMVEDPNNPGSYMEEQVVAISGERGRVTAGDKLFANAVHHRAGEWAEDEIINDAVADAWTSLWQDHGGLLGKQNLVETLEAVGQLDRWNQRMLLSELLQPRQDNWAAAAVVFDDNLPEIAGSMRAMARRDSYDVKELAGEIRNRANETKMAGPKRGQTQEEFEEHVNGLFRTAQKLDDIAPVVQGLDALNTSERAWLSAVVSRQMSSENKAYDLDAVRAWAAGETGSRPTNRIYRGVPDGYTLRINPDGSLTLLPQAQTQWNGRTAISLTTDPEQAAQFASRRGKSDAIGGQDIASGAVIEMDLDWMLAEMGTSMDELASGVRIKSTMDGSEPNGIYMLSDGPSTDDAGKIDWGHRGEFAIATPEEFTIPKGRWKIQNRDEYEALLTRGGEIDPDLFRINGVDFDEVAPKLDEALDNWVAGLTEEEQALLVTELDQQLNEVEVWAENRWGGAEFPSPVLADVIYSGNIPDAEGIEGEVYRKLREMLETELADGVTAADVMVAIGRRDRDIESQMGTLDDIFREKLMANGMYRQFDQMNQRNVLDTNRSVSSKALDLVRDGWGLRGTGGFSNLAYTQQYAPFVESFDEMRTMLVNEVAARLALPKNQQWVKQSDWMTTTADGRPIVQPPGDGLTRIYTPVVPPHSTKVDAILDNPNVVDDVLDQTDKNQLIELRTLLRTKDDATVDDIAAIIERGFMDEEMRNMLVNLGIDYLDQYPGNAVVPMDIRKKFEDVVESYMASDLDAAAQRLLDEAPQWAFNDPVIQKLTDEERLMYAKRALSDYQRGRMEYAVATSVPLHHVAFDDPRIAKWLSSLMSDTPDDVARVGQLEVPRDSLTDSGLGRNGVRLMNSSETSPRAWDLTDRYTALARATDAPAFHHAPYELDGKTGFDVVIGTSQEEALRDWAGHIVDHVLMSNRRGVMEAQVANERASTSLARIEGDKFVPLEKGERMSGKTDLFEYDPEDEKVGKAVEAWGKNEYFEHEVVNMEDDLMWGITGPMLRDFYERGQFDRLVPKDFRERKGMFGRTKKVDADTTLQTDQLVNMTRSRVDDISLEPSAALPNVAITQNYRGIYDTVWDRIVRFGFDKVIGPAIDALIRKPMSFHYYAQAYKQHKQNLSWMLNADLFETQFADAFADSLAILRGESTVAAEYLDHARIVAKAEFGVDLSKADDVEVQMWLSTLGEDTEDFRKQLADISAHQRSRAMGDAADNLPVSLEESRDAAWSAEKLRDLNRDAIAINIPRPGVGGRTESERLVAAYHASIPDEVWSDGYEKVVSYIRNYVPGLPSNFTDEQWKILKAARDNLKHVIDTADETATLRAMENVIPFLDSHEQRSMFAEYGRNLLPFWYAEENFVKRWVRTMSLGQFATPFGFTVPSGGLDAMRKAQLTYMGIKSAGVIQTDANGQDWVVYPGSQLLQEAVDRIPGMGDRLPIGVMFRATTDSMLPGITPESHVGASPFVTVPVGAVLGLFPDAQNMKRALLGDIGANKGIIDQFVPSVFANAWTAAFGDEDNSVRYASAMNSAIAFMEAEGRGLKDGATAADVDEYLDEVRNHARIIMVSQMIVGYVAPGAPSALATGDTGYLSFANVEDPRQILSTMYRDLIENLGIEEGTQAFLRTYPKADLEDIVNPMAFTTSATQSVSGAPLPATEHGIGWYTDNRDWVDAMPEAGAWFIPQDDREDAFDYYSYSQQLSSGLRKRRSPQELIEAIKYRQGATIYFESKDNRDAALEAVGNDSARAQKINDDFDMWKANFFAVNPIFAERLQSSESRIRRDRTITQLREAAHDPERPDSPYADAIQEMVDSYDAFRARYQDINKRTDARSREQARELKDAFANWAETWVLRNPQLERLWTAVYRPEARID